MKTFRLIKSSLGITIFLFSFYIVIKMLFFQKDFSLIIYFNFPAVLFVTGYSTLHSLEFGFKDE